MAPRNPNLSNNNNGGGAEQTVFDNLDLDPNELGGGDPQLEDDGGGEDELDLDDEPDDEDPFRLSDEEIGQGEGDDDGGDPNRLSQTGQRRPKKRPLPKKAEVKPDGKGNLVDSKGNIVARGGAQARLYQRAERARRDLASVNDELVGVKQRLGQLAQVARNLHNENQTYKATQAAFEKLNLKADEQLQAMTMFVQLRDNPQQAIRAILTRAAARGINVQELGQNGGVDAKSIADLVKNEVSGLLKPINDRNSADEAERARQREAEQVNQRAAEEVRTFFGRHPEAQKYATVFQRVVRDPRYQGWSLADIWVKISENLRQQRERTPGKGGMPRGRSNAPSGNSTYASPNESYDSIVKDVLATAQIGR